MGADRAASPSPFGLKTRSGYTAEPMSYPQAPAFGSPPSAAKATPGSAAAEATIRALLGDLAGRKEFQASRAPAGAPASTVTSTAASEQWAGYAPAPPGHLFLPGLRLSGAQLFIRNFENPDTDFTRVLIKWQTGTGKSIAAISISQEFIRQFRARAALGERAPTVFVISFTARETIQEDMLRYPEFGFVSQAEVEELRQLRSLAGAAGPASAEARQLSGLVGVLRRRITDRGRGGYYQFYGYKEFANRLFVVTRAGLERGFDIQALYGRASREDAEVTFGERLAESVKRGDVVINEDLLAEMRGGLLIADEIHNVYNILETNNYGIAIQYALDALGAEAPRAVYMSATPMTGSAAEVVDLLNLLVPRSALPGGVPLRRTDFFTRAAAPARPPYREKPGGSFTHDGKRYDINCAFEQADRRPVRRIAVTELRWILEPPEADPAQLPDDEERIARADLTAPLLITPWRGRLAVVDGAHRLTRAMREGVADLPTRLLTETDLASCEVGGRQFKSRAVEAAEDPDEMSSFVISQLREEALERIAHLAAGRVSFLLDADVGSYPRREFVGEEVAGVPYLRLTPCPMAPFHERTLAREQAPSLGAEAAAEGPALGAGIAPNAYTLYDIAFPNPGFAPDAAASAGGASYGLYRSGETPMLLGQAPEEWRAAAGVVVEKGAEAGVSAGTYVISGGFLGPERLALYSTKFARIVEAALAAVRDGPGKVMIYHHRVRMSGVLLLQEALRMNGFADETGSATDTTVCAICGVARAAHGRAGGQSAGGQSAGGQSFGRSAPEALPHDYTPARFVVAHSDVDRAVMMRSIARFNAPTNLQGHQYRVIIGSKIVREGLNFRGVRRQFIASLPTDYPTLVQVFGRVVRKDSHSELPADERDVKISVFVTTRADGRPSPELQRYVDKGREYLVIQEVERALHTYAVDGFANYERIRTALHAGPGGELRASLDALPYSPVVGPSEAAARPLRAATYLAYGHGEREVATLAAIARVLFRARPVWTYADLWGAVRAGAVRGVSFDAAAFDEGNFALALESLRRPAGDPPMLVTRAGRFYIAARAQPDGTPALDVESYLRSAPPPAGVSVRVADYVREARSGQNWEVRLREFERAYLRGDAASTPELSLVEYGAAFHYALIRRLVAAPAGEEVTIDDARVRELYRRFRVVITAADAATPAARRVFRGGRSKDPDDLIGYVTPEAVSLYDPAGARWYNASHADFGIGRRHRENNVVVGFIASLGPAGASGEAFTAAAAAARFKLRPPIQKLRAEAAGRRGLAAGPKGDIRSLARGAVCETRPREELEAYLRRLRDEVTRAGVRPQATRGGSAKTLVARLDYAAKFDRAAQKRFPSAGEMCDALRLHLLALEENARAPANGMTSGLRWLYLFNDRPPTVSALMGKTGKDDADVADDAADNADVDAADVNDDAADGADND